MAIELFAEVGRWLGIGLANLAAALDPGMFVIGGGVSDAGELLLGAGAAVVPADADRARLPARAAIVEAALGPEAGLVGAADLARCRLTATGCGRLARCRPRPVLRVLTWNVHDLLGDPLRGRRGCCGRRAADVVCLQEAPRLARLAVQARVAGPRRPGCCSWPAGGRSAGTALLCSMRAGRDGRGRRRGCRRAGLRTRPRGLVHARVGLPGTAALHVASVHLGLPPQERARHLRLLRGADGGVGRRPRWWRGT